MNTVENAFTPDQLTKIGIREEYRGLQLQRFVDALDRPKCRDYVMEFMAGKLSGLFLFGSNGCGKTSMISAMVWELIHNHRIQCCIISVEELVVQYKELNWKLPPKVLQAEILFLEEIGKESDVTTGGRVLEMLLKMRFENGKKVVVTANADIDDIFKVYENPTIKSMLLGNCWPVKFPVVDYRIKNMERKKHG